MKLRCFTIPALFLCACAVVEIPSFASTTVGIYLDFDSAPSAVTFANLKQEVVAIMQPSGLQLEWRDISEREKHESFPTLLVIRLTGRCDSAAHLYGTYSPEAQAAALASTTVVDGRVLPFGEIQCDEVRHYIAPLTRGRRDPEAVLGRAIGRVMAHEMYHMLLEETVHSEQGVARAKHHRDELVSRRFTFAATETDRLRSYANRIGTPGH